MKSNYVKHHSNTTKISRLRQVMHSRDKSKTSDISSSIDDGLTATIQKCIEGTGAVNDQVTESEKSATGEKHLIISTLKSNKGGKIPKPLQKGIR